jgi:plasmid maintenance system antidote protein VapI
MLTHPLLRWAQCKQMTVDDVAAAAGCSPSHIRNICAGRKDASLALAKRLSALSDDEIPMDAFLRESISGAAQ